MTDRKPSFNRPLVLLILRFRMCQSATGFLGEEPEFSRGGRSEGGRRKAGGAQGWKPKMAQRHSILEKVQRHNAPVQRSVIYGY